jgi:hypothetical protein
MVEYTISYLLTTLIVAAAGTAVIAGLCGVVTGAAAGAGVGTPSVAGASAWSAGDMAIVRRPGVHQKMCRLLAWMKSQVHSCHRTTKLASHKSISEA